jgi:tRNA modification GTPase
MLMDETIAAIATPVGEGGVGIVRISGKRALEIASVVFKSADGVALLDHDANTFTYGSIRDKDGVHIDGGLALVMRGPKSFTGEDTVELQGHGGAVVLRRVLRRVLEAGARMAEPGEFSRRAFLNGRMDLTQAEGLFDLIRARSDRAAQVAIEQLEGVLSRSFNGLYDAFLEVTANLETTLDFVEDELPDDVFSGIAQKLDHSFQVLDDLLETWNEGRLLREGVRVVILGRPNAGKSTLLNALLGFERAIVSEVAGTTRDTIEEQWVLNGIPLRLTDTAGLRVTDCRVEAEGIRRAEAHGESAELIIYVLDASKALSKEDQARLDELPVDRSVVVLNKTDLGQEVLDVEGVPVSLLNGSGLAELKLALIQKLEAGAEGGTAHAVISERHRALLIQARDEAKQARAYLIEHIEQQAALACDHLRSALEHLGHVTGRTYHDELLDNIFSRFCIGK